MGVSQIGMLEIVIILGVCAACLVPIIIGCAAVLALVLTRKK